MKKNCNHCLKLNDLNLFEGALSYMRFNGSNFFVLSSSNLRLKIQGERVLEVQVRS